MKRILCIIMCFACLLMVSCSNTPSDSAGGNYDIDLTLFSDTVAYSEVYHIVSSPGEYLGKQIRMRGTFSTYQDPATALLYFACLVTDTTSCCSQGIEFLLANPPRYPDGYPPVGSEITVSGELQTYEENGTVYCRLNDARLE